jgi:acetylornithine deacetylase/succinyl-diaminopimelate desuccinylase-like protein
MMTTKRFENGLFNKPSNVGVQSRSYSSPPKANLQIDEMGSIFATRPGENNDIPPIGLGSHLDTQPKGGRYDGLLGVHAALEVLRTIHDAGHKTYAPLCIVDWTNEEGARFAPAMIASGVWGGAFELDYAHQRADPDGNSIKHELERTGFLGSTACSHVGNPLSAHLECHIEQGFKV